VDDIYANGSITRSKITTAKQRNTLRDALIFESHLKNKNDIFVTKDEKGFVKYGHREKLQDRYNTQIMTYNEFLLCVK